MTRSIRSLASGATAMAFCLAIAGASANASEARPADLMVRYDQSQLLRLPRPATEVIIGNPSIADVAIQGGNLLVVTGKSFGVTNIIALDAQRNVIQDQRVVVDHDDLRRLSLYKGSKRESYTCTPDCAPTITVGDGVEYFDAISKSTQTKSTAASGAVDKGNQSSNE
jgi:Pilus formation protein N terminal region